MIHNMNELEMPMFLTERLGPEELQTLRHFVKTKYGTELYATFVCGRPFYYRGMTYIQNGQFNKNFINEIKASQNVNEDELEMMREQRLIQTILMHPRIGIAEGMVRPEHLECGVIPHILEDFNISMGLMRNTVPRKVDDMYINEVAQFLAEEQAEQALQPVQVKQPPLPINPNQPLMPGVKDVSNLLQSPDVKAELDRQNMINKREEKLKKK